MARKILYVTGTRADFGLMRTTLAQIDASDSLDLAILATGMHLSQTYGGTIAEVEDARLRIAARVDVEEGTPTGALMSRNIGRMMVGFTGVIEAERPDVVLTLGDRGEMLAAATAAIHLNVPIAHLHGGERSGTVDEPVRHAISKLAHYHLAATHESRDRLIRMGEDEWRIFVVGAPGLDGLAELARQDRNAVCAAHGLDPARKFALMIFHPVVQEADACGAIAELLLSKLQAAGIQVLALMPNSDAGSLAVRETLSAWRESRRIALATHMSRPDYVSAMAACDVMVGNSSSGIIEAATFGTPVVNIGSRQNLRQRNANVIDASASAEEIDAALEKALFSARSSTTNVYGDGNSGARIVSLLETVDLGPQLLKKVNAY